MIIIRSRKRRALLQVVGIVGGWVHCCACLFDEKSKLGLERRRKHSSSVHVVLCVNKRKVSQSWRREAWLCPKKKENQNKERHVRIYISFKVLSKN